MHHKMLCRMILNVITVSRVKNICISLCKTRTGYSEQESSSFIPISRLSCPPKVYEYILTNRLKEFITANSITIPEQFEFQPKLLTQHHLWRVAELTHDDFFRRGKIRVVFIDIARLSTESGAKLSSIN